VVLHPLCDDRRILPIERTGELLTAPAEFMLVVSYNPGYQNLLKGMKPSTRQRFVSMRFDYPDIATETTIVQKEADVDKTLAVQLIELAHALRVLKDHDLEESASTRLLVYAATLIKSGFPPIEACRAAIIEPLSDDEETVEALMEVVRAKIEE
jgi:nitric oxide reductase NorQ protein